MRPISRPRAAFTLIELLVVIAIISILAAIIFPVFNRARDMARRATCQSNLKQISLGLLQYTQDFDERLPSSQDGAGATAGIPDISWNYFTNAGGGANSFDMSRSSLFPYLKSKQIFVCPSDSGGQSSGASYAANSCVFHDATEPAGTALLRTGRALSDFPDSSLWMMFTEESAVFSSTDDAYLNRQLPNDFATIHAGGSNVAFLDGHVKWRRADRLRLDFPQTATAGDCSP